MARAWLDEEFDDDQETWIIGNAAAGLFARSLAACAKNRSDGWVSEAWAFARVPGSKRNRDSEGQIAALVNHGWWQPMRAGEVHEVFVERDPEGFALTVGPFGVDGFFVPNFVQKNPTSVELAAVSRARSEAGRKGALKAWGPNGTRRSKRAA